MMITGHRDIRGERALLIRESLKNVLRALQGRHPEGLVAVSGMAVGVDAEFVEAAIFLGIPFVAAVPVEDQDVLWPAEAKARYADQLRRAALVVRVWEDPRYAASSYGSKMHARNRWMLDHVAVGSGIVVAVWDGRQAGGTWAAVSEALRRQRKVLVVDPRTGKVRVETPPPPSEDRPWVEVATRQYKPIVLPDWPWGKEPWEMTPQEEEALRKPLSFRTEYHQEWDPAEHSYFGPALRAAGVLSGGAERAMDAIRDRIPRTNFRKPVDTRRADE